MYEMSQRHPVWVAENHVNPCNSVAPSFSAKLSTLNDLQYTVYCTVWEIYITVYTEAM
jgi:hypothetical protein